MKIVIENTKKLTDDIFSVLLTPDELSFFNKPAYNDGSYSIIFVNEEPMFDAVKHILYLDPLRSTLLNVGTTDNVLIINSVDKESAKMMKSLTTGKPLDRLVGIGGDRLFLNRLPKELSILGKNLLAGVRDFHRGELRYHPRSNKFVETPKNFWSVKIQPRAISLRLTIKGGIDNYSDFKDFDFKNDIRTFCSFIVNNRSDIKNSVKVIKRAFEISNK